MFCAHKNCGFKRYAYSNLCPHHYTIKWVESIATYNQEHANDNLPSEEEEEDSTESEVESDTAMNEIDHDDDDDDIKVTIPSPNPNKRTFTTMMDVDKSEVQNDDDAATASPSAEALVQQMRDAVETAARKVFGELGGGHLESVYHQGLYLELSLGSFPLGYVVETEKSIQVYTSRGCVGTVRPDLVVTHTSTGESIIIELKSLPFGGAIPGRKKFQGQLEKYFRTTQASAALLILFCETGIVCEFLERDAIVLLKSKQKTDM